MIIIWGSKYRKNEEGTLEYTCIICQHNLLQVYSFRRWFTFFFVPIFPTSSKDYYVECSECENTYKFNSLEELMKEEETSQNAQEN